MRSIFFIFFLAVCSGFTGIKNTPFQSPVKLNGTWIPVKQEMNGTPLPKTAFEKQKLIIKDSSYTVIAEGLDQGTISYKGNKMDIYGKEGPNAGMHFTAIYKYENTELTICYNLSGNSYPEKFETKSSKSFFLSVFKKEVSN
jgi:uncharacterized protein (TIGR03067 family)